MQTLLKLCKFKTFGKECKRANAIAPVPEPTSRNRMVNLSSHCCKINSTSSSVSGRGMNTGGRTFNLMLQKSHSPTIYWIGIRAKRASQRFSKFFNCTSFSKSLLSFYMGKYDDKKNLQIHFTKSKANPKKFRFVVNILCDQ